MLANNYYPNTLYPGDFLGFQIFAQMDLSLLLHLYLTLTEGFPHQYRLNSDLLCLILFGVYQNQLEIVSLVRKTTVVLEEPPCHLLYDLIESDYILLCIYIIESC